MFSHVPCVALEENSDKAPSYQEADNDESSAEDKGMVYQGTILKVSIQTSTPLTLT